MKLQKLYIGMHFNKSVLERQTKHLQFPTVAPPGGGLRGLQPPPPSQVS